MNEFQWVNIIWLLGALVLAGGALAGYRLNWKRSIVYILIWGSIFAAATLFIDAVTS